MKGKKALLGHRLFLYQSVLSISRPQLLLVLLEIWGERMLGCWDMGNVTAVLVIIKGTGYLRDTMVAEKQKSHSVDFLCIRNINITALTLLEMR